MSALMNYNNTCGYASFKHTCAKGQVSFIVRYFGNNDYCVSGRRVRIHDDQTSNASLEERRLLWHYFLNKYAEYCIWHAEMKYKNPDYWPALQAFEMGGFDELLNTPSRSGLVSLSEERL